MYNNAVMLMANNLFSIPHLFVFHVYHFPSYLSITGLLSLKVDNAHNRSFPKLKEQKGGISDNHLFDFVFKISTGYKS